MAYRFFLTLWQALRLIPFFGLLTGRSAPATMKVRGEVETSVSVRLRGFLAGSVSFCFSVFARAGGGR